MLILMSLGNGLAFLQFKLTTPQGKIKIFVIVFGCVIMYFLYMLENVLYSLKL